MSAERACGVVERNRSLLFDAAAVWFLLAGLGQLVYLAQWPQYIAGQGELARGWSVALGLLRMGLYGSIGVGLLNHSGTAWALAVCEIARTVLVFVVVSLTRRWTIGSGIFPAAWAHGVLSGALPFVVLLHAAKSQGWQPGRHLDTVVALVVRVLAAAGTLGGVALRREASGVGIAPGDQKRLLLTLGLPVVLGISLLELAAVWLGSAPVPGR